MGKYLIDMEDGGYAGMYEVSGEEWSSDDLEEAKRVVLSLYADYFGDSVDDCDPDEFMAFVCVENEDEDSDDEPLKRIWKPTWEAVKKYIEGLKNEGPVTKAADYGRENIGKIRSSYKKYVVFDEDRTDIFAETTREKKDGTIMFFLEYYDQEMANICLYSSDYSMFEDYTREEGDNRKNQKGKKTELYNSYIGEFTGSGIFSEIYHELYQEIERVAVELGVEVEVAEI